MQPTLELGNPTEAIDWITNKLSDLMKLAESASTLMNVALSQALGPMGTAGDPEHIVYVARKIGDVYRNIIQWTIDFTAVEVEENLKKIIQIVSTFSKTLLEELEGYSVLLQDELPKIITRAESDESEPTNLTLTLSPPPMQIFSAEMKRLGRIYNVS